MACVHERRGGSDSDIAVDIVLQRFKMKGEKKKNLSKCPCGAKFVRQQGVCVRGKLDVKGTKDLQFFLRGGYQVW